MKLADTEKAGLSATELEAIESPDPDVTDLQAILADGDDRGAEVTASATAPVAEAFIPRYHAQPVENYDQRMQELDAQRRDVVQRFKDGDLHLDEMMAERDKLDDERAQLRHQQFDFISTARREEQVDFQLWGSHVSNFQRQHPEYSLGADGQPVNAAMYHALDGIVKQLGTNPKVIAEHGNDHAWYLNEAHRIVQEQAAATHARDATVTHGRESDAGARDAGRDEFAHIDKLEGLEFEQAVARLSPEQQARYATGLGY